LQGFLFLKNVILLSYSHPSLVKNKNIFNPNYSLEAKRANELVGFNLDLEKLE
jgi:hypothetical protein